MAFYRFAYATDLRICERQLPFRTRDGAAFAELMAALTGMQGEYDTYGTLIYNYPRERMREPPTKEAFDFLTPADWIVLTTRPPKDDGEDSRPTVRKSGSHLETAIFSEIAAFLRVCKRSEIELTPKYAVRAGVGMCRFKQNVDGRMIAHRGADPASRETKVPRRHYRTLGFLIRKRRMEHYGCGLLACFSMGGLETLIWNRVVRTRHAEWLRNATFVVAELNIGQALSGAPMTLDFVKNVEVKVLLYVQ